jgi:hypothetical protein
MIRWAASASDRRGAEAGDRCAQNRANNLEATDMPDHRFFHDVNLQLTGPGPLISRDKLSLTLANFRRGGCAECPRIWGYTEFLVGPGRAWDRTKIPASIGNACKMAASEQRKLAKVQLRSVLNYDFADRDRFDEFYMQHNGGYFPEPGIFYRDVFYSSLPSTKCMWRDSTLFPSTTDKKSSTCPQLSKFESAEHNTPTSWAVPVPSRILSKDTFHLPMTLPTMTFGLK